jgi:hypothetical protein
MNSQGASAIAFGFQAGATSQGSGAIAIGWQAGYTFQGANAIAIGSSAVGTTQAAGSIALNASAISIAATEAGFYAAPIRSDTTTGNAVVYNTTTKELIYNTSKTFVIDHPVEAEKYLVHACLEGPEAGVYYRGEGVVEAGKGGVRVELPAYAAALAVDFTVQVTAVDSEEEAEADAPVRIYAAGAVVGGAFRVRGPAGRFFWHATGRRALVEVEPLKAAVEVKGDGPYRYIA